MKKVLIIMMVLLLPGVAFAENTSWIKGGKAWGDLTACTYAEEADLKSASCVDADTEDEFFFQVSPFNVRGKINKSKVGYRFEPWIGYSQSSASESNTFDGQLALDSSGPVPAPNINSSVDYDFKNIQLGFNMFLDYEVINNFEVYGGPLIGFEVNEISAEANVNQANLADTDPAVLDPIAGFNADGIYDSGFDSNFFWGGEFGAEYKIMPAVAIGGFMQWIVHDNNIHADIADAGGASNDLGTEMRAGAGLTYYW